MFKTKIIKQISKIIVVLILLSGALTLSGCSLFNKKLKIGYHPAGEFAPDYLCACESDRKIFDIDDVSLTFHFGRYEDEYQENICDSNIPSFYLTFENDNGKELIIKEIDEQMLSKKYTFHVEYTRIFFIYVSNVIFNYSEQLTIPRELFDSQKGYIVFSVKTDYKDEFYNLANVMSGPLDTSIRIYYKKISDNKVKLSSTEFK